MKGIQRPNYGDDQCPDPNPRPVPSQNWRTARLYNVAVMSLSCLRAMAGFRGLSHVRCALSVHRASICNRTWNAHHEWLCTRGVHVEASTSDDCGPRKAYKGMVDSGALESGDVGQRPTSNLRLYEHLTARLALICVAFCVDDRRGGTGQPSPTVASVPAAHGT
eukprot:1195464-Prorocentrum_minimum.AAC.3